MFEAQVTYYLNLYLGKYLHGLDAESLKISVWKGDVELRNLQLRTEALTELQLPITVKAGLLGRLTIKVPWAKLGREPIVVEFDRLYLLAGPPQYPTSSDALSTETVESYESSMDQLELEAKRKRVAEAELKWLEEQEARKSKASNASSSKAPAAQPQDESIAKTLGGRLQTMIEPILGNLQLKLSNVHVRYEEGDEDEMEGEGETPPDPSSASISAAAAPTSPDKARAIGVRGRRARAERRQRCVLGLMLGEVTAHTVDANGQRAFVVDHVLECLRKAVELSKLCAYFDVGPEYPLASSSSSIHTSSLDPSSKLGKKVQGGEKGPRSFIGASVKPPRSGCSWSEVTPGEWDALLLPALHYQERGGGSGGMPIKGASSALGGGGGGGGGGGRTQPSAVSSSSQEDAYRHDFILCPVSGGMKYTRRSPKFRASDEDAKQEAKLSLREVQLRLSQPQYMVAQRILQAFELHQANAPFQHLRPKYCRPGDGSPHSAKVWWRYAFRCVAQQTNAQRSSCSWLELKRVAELRKQYVPHYATCILDSMASKQSGGGSTKPSSSSSSSSSSPLQLGGDEAIVAMDKRLGEGAILLFRRLAHAEVEVELARRLAATYTLTLGGNNNKIVSNVQGGAGLWVPRQKQQQRTWAAWALGLPSDASLHHSQLPSASSSNNTQDPTSTALMKPTLDAEEMKKLEQMIADREAEVAKEEAEEAARWSQRGGTGGAPGTEQSPYSLQLLLEVSIDSASVRLISDSLAAASSPPSSSLPRSATRSSATSMEASREAGEVCRASMSALKIQLKSFPITIAVSLAVGRASIDSSQGPLFSTAVLSSSSLLQPKPGSPPKDSHPPSVSVAQGTGNNAKAKTNPFSRPSIRAPDGRPSAFVLNFKSRPQEGDADATLSLLIAPSYVTYLPAAVASTVSFFTTGAQSLRLTTLKAQASARAEEIRRLAQLQIRSLTALEDRPRLSVQLLCHAPKVAIPDASGNCNLLVDLGRFKLQSLRASEAGLNGEEAALFECFSLKIDNVSAYIYDGSTFAWHPSAVSLTPPTADGTSDSASPSSEIDPILASSSMTLLDQVALQKVIAKKQPLHQQHPGGIEPATSSSSHSPGVLLVPLLDRFQVSIQLQAATSSHPRLPQARIALFTSPVHFYFSPTRYHRLMSLLATALSSPSSSSSTDPPCHVEEDEDSEDAAGLRGRASNATRQKEPIWHRESEYECRGFVLSWEGLAGHKASWKPRLLSLWQGKLYVTTPPAFSSEAQAAGGGGGKRVAEDAAAWVSAGGIAPSDGMDLESWKTAEVRSFWRMDARVLELQPGHIGGARNCLALAPDGLTPQSVPESPSALILRLNDQESLREMKKQLLKSRTAMQSLAGLLNPLGDNTADTEDPSISQAAGQQGSKNLSLAAAEDEEADVYEETLKHKDWLEVAATIEELTLRLSGRVPSNPWWPDQAVEEYAQRQAVDPSVMGSMTTGDFGAGGGGGGGLGWDDISSVWAGDAQTSIPSASPGPSPMKPSAFPPPIQKEQVSSASRSSHPLNFHEEHALAVAVFRSAQVRVLLSQDRLSMQADMKSLDIEDMLAGTKCIEQRALASSGKEREDQGSSVFKRDRSLVIRRTMFGRPSHVESEELKGDRDNADDDRKEEDGGDEDEFEDAVSFAGSVAQEEDYEVPDDIFAKSFLTSLLANQPADKTPNLLNPEAADAGSSERLVSLGYLMNFSSSDRYTGMDSEAFLKLSALELFFHRPTIASLMTLGLDLAAANTLLATEAEEAKVKQAGSAAIRRKPAEEGFPAGASVTHSARSSIELPSLRTPSVASKAVFPPHSALEAVPEDLPLRKGGPQRTLMRLKLEMRELRLSLCYEGGPSHAITSSLPTSPFLPMDPVASSPSPSSSSPLSPPPPLLVASVGPLLSELDVHPSSLKLSASLGNAVIVYGLLPCSSPNQTVCELRPGTNGSLIQFTFKMHGKDEESQGRAPPGLSHYSFTGRLSAVRLVFMQRFINDLMAYISGTLAMMPLPLSLPEAAKLYLQEQQRVEEARIRGQRMMQRAGLGGQQDSRASQAHHHNHHQPLSSLQDASGPCYVTTQGAVIGPNGQPLFLLLVDVDLSAPLIVVPETSFSKAGLELDLGSAHVKNQIQWRIDQLPSPSTSPSLSPPLPLQRRILMDEMTISLQDMGLVLTSEPDGARGSNLIHQATEGFRVSISRPLVQIPLLPSVPPSSTSPPTLSSPPVLPPMQVVVIVPEIQASLLESEYSSLLGITQKNMAEPSIEPVDLGSKLLARRLKEVSDERAEAAAEVEREAERARRVARAPSAAPGDSRLMGSEQEEEEVEKGDGTKEGGQDPYYNPFADPRTDADDLPPPSSPLPPVDSSPPPSSSRAFGFDLNADEAISFLNDSCSMKVSISVARARLSLSLDSGPGRPLPQPLTSVTLVGLWAGCHFTRLGSSLYSLHIVGLSIEDLRPGTPLELSRVLSTAMATHEDAGRLPSSSSSPGPGNDHDDISLFSSVLSPSLLTAEYRFIANSSGISSQGSSSGQQVGGAGRLRRSIQDRSGEEEEDPQGLDPQVPPEGPLQAARVRVQRPTLVLDLPFLLAISSFITRQKSQGALPRAFETKEILLGPQPYQADSDLFLSPEYRILADAPGTNNTFVYDGCGHRLVLPAGLHPSSPLPLILVGSACTLELRNVVLINCDSLGACLQLGVGGRLLMKEEGEEGGVKMVTSAAASTMLTKGQRRGLNALFGGGGRGAYRASAPIHPPPPGLGRDSSNSGPRCSRIEFNIDAIGASLHLMDSSIASQVPQASSPAIPGLHHSLSAGANAAPYSSFVTKGQAKGGGLTLRPISLSPMGAHINAPPSPLLPSASPLASKTTKRLSTLDRSKQGKVHLSSSAAAQADSIKLPPGLLRRLALMFDSSCSYRSTTIQPSFYDISFRGAQARSEQKATVSIRGLTVKALTTVPSTEPTSLLQLAASTKANTPLAPAYSSVVIPPPIHSPLLDRASSMFSENTYKITVKTSDLLAAGSDSSVSVNIIGTPSSTTSSEESHSTGLLPLGSQGKILFERNATDVFVVNARDVGRDVSKLIVSFQGRGVGSSWHLEYIEVVDMTRGSTFTFPCGQWFDTLGGKEGGEGASIQKTLVAKKQEGLGLEGASSMRPMKSRRFRRPPFPSYAPRPSSSSLDHPSTSSTAPPLAAEVARRKPALELVSPVLDPCDLFIDYSDGQKRSDLILDLTRLSLKLSPDILQLLLQLQRDVVKPIAIPPPNKPLVQCDRFDCVWTATAQTGPGGHDSDADEDQTLEVIDQNGYKAVITTADGSDSCPGIRVSLLVAGHKQGKRLQSIQAALDASSRVDESSSPSDPFQPGATSSFFLQLSDLGTIDSVTITVDSQALEGSKGGRWRLQGLELLDTVRATSYQFSINETFAQGEDAMSIKMSFKPNKVVQQSSLLRPSSENTPVIGESGTRLSLKGSRRTPQLSVWSPQTPGGYVKLGDVLSSPGEPPAISAVAAAAVNSGLVAYPKGFELVWWEGPLLTFDSVEDNEDDDEEEEGLLVIWRPVPPDGYHSMGCVATSSRLIRFDADQAIYQDQDLASASPSPLNVLQRMDAAGRRHLLVPPQLSSVGCIHRHALVEASAGQCYLLPSLNTKKAAGGAQGDEEAASQAWAVLNAAGTFQVSASCSQPFSSFLDLRSPLGVPPAALLEPSSLSSPSPTFPASIDRSPTSLASKSSQDLFLARRSKFIKAVASQRSVANAIEFTRIWWDRNDPSSSSSSSSSSPQGSHVKVGFWRPIPPPGYVSLGDCMVTGIYAPPRSALVIRDVDPSVALSSQGATPPLLARPIGYTKAWLDDHLARAGFQDPLSIWRPIPPAGYVALGMVAATGQLPPSVNVMRCIRVDAATSVTLSRDYPDWMSYPARHRTPLYAWITDERSGTFLAMNQGEVDGKVSAAALMAAVGAVGVQRQAPKLEAWRAKLGDEEDEDLYPSISTTTTPPTQPLEAGGGGSASPSPLKQARDISSPADEVTRPFKASSIELRCPKATLLLRNTQRTPIVEVGALDMRLGVGSQSEGVTRGFAFLTLSLCTYQPDMSAWEPLLEPWQLLMHLDQSKLSKMSQGVSPGTLIRATSTQSTVNLSLAYGPTTVLLANMPEWSLAMIASSTSSTSSSSSLSASFGSGGREAEAIAASAAKQLLLRQLAAAEGSTVQSLVTNSLGVTCQMLVDMGEAQGQELLTLQPGQTRTVSQPVHPPPSSLGSSHYYNDKNPIDALSTISIRGSPGSFKRSSPSSSPNKYPGTSEATHPHAQAKSSGGGSAFLWILLDVLACRREEASTRYSFDGGSEAASTAHWTAQAPPLAPASPPAANGELISGSLEPLFAHGCEIQCHVTVKGVVSALMPELAAGISTRAVAIPQLVAHQGADSAADASGVSLETEVQWLERFVIRLPSELCEVLLDKGHRLDPQFLGTPMELEFTLTSSGGCGGRSQLLGHATLPVDFDWLANQAMLLQQLETRHKVDLIKAQWHDHVLPPHLRPDTQIKGESKAPPSSSVPPRPPLSSSGHHHRDKGGSLSGHNNKAEPSLATSDMILIEDHSLAGMLVELNVRLDPSLTLSSLPSPSPLLSPLILTVSIAFDLSQVDTSSLSSSLTRATRKGSGAYTKLKEVSWDSSHPSKSMAGRRALRVLSSTDPSTRMLSTSSLFPPGISTDGSSGGGGGGGGGGIGRGSLWSPFHPNSTSHLGSGVTDGSIGSGSAHGLTLIPVGPGVVLETSTIIASSSALSSSSGTDSNTTATRRELLRSLCQVINETEMTVEVCILAKPSFSALALSQENRGSSSSNVNEGRNEEGVDEEVFENERYDPVKKVWGYQFLANGERRRYNTRREDGGGDSLSFPQVSLPNGWEWCGSWKVEVGHGTDDEGWCYGLLWPDVNFPFDANWNVRGEGEGEGEGGVKGGPVDPFEVRRRRWTRSRRETPEGKEARVKADLLSSMDPRSIDRLLLGKLGPGGRLPLPLSWSNQEAGFELQFRPCETDERQGGVEREREREREGEREREREALLSSGYEWSQNPSASGGDGPLILTSLEEGATRLFICSPKVPQNPPPPDPEPAPSASPLGFRALVNQPGGLAPPSTSPSYSTPLSPSLWISVGVECEHISCPAQSASASGEETRRDWKVILRPPLIIKNFLPADAKYTIWQPKLSSFSSSSSVPTTLTPPSSKIKGSYTKTAGARPGLGGSLKIVGGGEIEAGGLAHVHVADMTRACLMTFQPEGCEYSEGEPVVVSEGWVGGVSGFKGLPDSFCCSYGRGSGSSLPLRVQMMRLIQDGDGTPAISYRLIPFLGSGSSSNLRREDGDKAFIAASQEAAQAMHRGCQMTLTLTVPLWIVNATSLSISAGLVPLADEKEVESMMEGFFDGGASAREVGGSRVYTKLKASSGPERAVGDLRLMDTEGPAPSPSSPSSSPSPGGHVSIQASSVEMMGQPLSPLTSFDVGSGGGGGGGYSEERPQGIVLRVMGSKWTLPIALPSVTGPAGSQQAGALAAAAAESRARGGNTSELLSGSDKGMPAATHASAASLSSFQSYEPVLIRARSSDGNVYEVVARFTLASALSQLAPGYSSLLSSLPPSSALALSKAASEAGGSSLVLRLEAHLLVSNQTGYPLHLIQPLSLNASKASSSTPGNINKKGGSTSTIDRASLCKILKLKSADRSSPLHWSSAASKRLLALSLPTNQDSGGGGGGGGGGWLLWSEPFKVEYPGGGGETQAVLPVYCLGEAGQYDRMRYIWRGSSNAAAGEEGAAPLSDVARKLEQAVDSSRSLLHRLSSSSGFSSTSFSFSAVSSSSTSSPEPCVIRVSKMTEAGPMAFLAVLVSFNLQVVAPGCLKLNLSCLGAEPQLCIHNATPHALRFRESRSSNALWCHLPAYSSVPFVKQDTSQGSNHPPEVEIGEAPALPGQPSTSTAIEVLSFEAEEDMDPSNSSDSSSSSLTQPPPLPFSSSSSSSFITRAETSNKTNAPLGSHITADRMMLGKTQAILKLGGIMRKSECLIMLATGLSESAASMMPDGLPSALRGRGGEGDDPSLSGREGRVAESFPLPSRMEQRLMRVVSRPTYPQSSKSTARGPGARTKPPLPLPSLSSSGVLEGAEGRVSGSGGGSGPDLIFDPQSDFPPPLGNTRGGSAAETFGIVIEVSSSLEISLVDGRPRELMTLTLDGLALEYKSGVTGGVDFTSVHATLKSAQLDDQLPGSPYPVVLLPLAEAEALVHPSPFGSARGGGKRGGGGGGDRAEPLLYFSFVSEPGRKKGALYCPCIVAKLAPVKISVAESLVWRMVAFASALTAAAEAASQSDPVANTVAAARASSSSALRSAMGGSGSNASIGARSTRLEGGGSGLPLQVDFLNIEDMELSLSFKTDPSSRPKSSSHLMSMGLDFLELEDLSLTIPGIERERVKMPKAMLLGLIVEGLQQRMIGIAFSLLRNYGVLGSASKILNAATSGMSKGLEVTKKDPVPTSSTPRGGGGAGGAGSKIDPSRKGSAGPSSSSSSSSAGQSRSNVSNIGDGVFEAGKAFAMNLFDGARGIVAKPIQGAEKGFGGFIEGVGKGLLGAVAAPVTGTLVAFSKVAEGIDSSYASVKSSILSLSQKRIVRRRLPRPFLGDRVLKPFLLDAALGQALLYDSCVSPSGLLSLNLSQMLTGRRRKGGGGGGEGPAYPFRSDLYENHFILNGAQVLVITNRRLVLLDASEFVWLQKRVMSGQPMGPISEVPGGDVTWQLPWEGLLAAEVAWHSQTPGLPPDGIILHRKRRGGPDNSILHNLRCRPGTSQAQDVLAAIQACRYKHYLLPKSEAAGWRELRGLHSDQGDEGGGGGGEGPGISSLSISPSPDQLKPDTMPSVEFKPVWYRRAQQFGSAGSSSSSSAMLKNAIGVGGGRKAISVWRPIGPPGYSSLGDVLVMGLETPPNPVKLYKDLSLFSVSSSSSSASASAAGGGGGLRIGGGEKESHDAPGEGPRLAPPIGYALIFRDSAYPPVTIWRPMPPPGYVEVGCVAWPDMEEPPLSLVRCMRKDLVMAAETYESFAWSGSSADNQWWRCTLWPIDNAAHTFLASKNDVKPDKARTPVY